MKNIIPYIATFLVLFSANGAFSQSSCDPNTPSFVLDLRGNPDSIWFSPEVVREGNCCETSHPDRCIEFVIYLDDKTGSINFNIVSGAVPDGSLFYQIDCGPQVQVGNEICISPGGPYRLTFCKPGANKNIYSIESLPGIEASPDISSSENCDREIWVKGLIESTITWMSYPNPVDTSYLSCAIGCDTTYVTPVDSTAPEYVDYIACGEVEGGCLGAILCDTVRVNFFSPITISSKYGNNYICPKIASVPIYFEIDGGVPPYNTLWSTGETTDTILS
ncbi:MAG: hypothetical protein ACJAZ3_002077 [Sphingobacteriales bacterium]